VRDKERECKVSHKKKLENDFCTASLATLASFCFTSEGNLLLIAVDEASVS